MTAEAQLTKSDYITLLLTHKFHAHIQATIRDVRVVGLKIMLANAADTMHEVHPDYQHLGYSSPVEYVVAYHLMVILR